MKLTKTQIESFKKAKTRQEAEDAYYAIQTKAYEKYMSKASLPREAYLTTQCPALKEYLTIQKQAYAEYDN